MAKSLWIKLDTYKRDKDENLFKFYHWLYGQVIMQVIQISRANYPVTMPTEDHDIVLCVSYEKRVRINKFINERSKSRRTCNAEIPGTACHPRSMFSKPSLELVGCPRGVNTNRGVVQSVAYILLWTWALK